MSRLLASEDAQDLLEYALLSAFIGVAGLVIWQAITGGVHDAYESWDAGVQDLAEPENPL